MTNNNDRSTTEALLFVLVFLFGFSLSFSFSFGYGLGFCSANFRKERPGCSWSWHFAQQQSSSCDLASIHRVPGITVLADRCTFQREPSKCPLGTGVGQDFCIHPPTRASLGMPSNWTRRC